MNRDSFARNAVAVYLREMAEVRGYGTAETSRYDPLAKLLNAVGDALDPKVSVIQQPRDIGHGVPDFGFFTEAQIKRGKNRGVADETPERGVAEIKPLSADIGELLASEQTKKYLRGYGLVLASNYRQFALVENNDGKPREISRFTLADSEKDFWEKAKHHAKTAAEFGERLCESLHRALLHNAPITTAAGVAEHLASYARETLVLLKSGDEKAMYPLRKSLESMLSMTFGGEDGDRFFHSTLAQSIYYALFSAWLQTPGKFDWKAAVHSANPVMGALFSQITNPGQLGKLNLTAQLDGATAMLNCVENKEALFGDIGAAGAIQHFYEPFVAEYDPELRKAMGVWYTPPEVVRYMVERADRVLRTELNIPDGLADDNVYVLDPCGGTGAYIAETLRRIHKTCEERGDGIGAAQTVKEAAKKRIIGFEIMSAPYLVAHWQVETLLKELGAPLKQGERAAIYLTNALTDWNESKRPPLNIPMLQKERDAAEQIKRESPILVILGNPPYNAFAGTSPKEEENLVEPYKEGLSEKWKIQKYNLDDLYVRFFRMAQNRIAKTGRGLVSFISNHSYIKKPSFVVMRQSLIGSFNKIWIDGLNGALRENGMKTPDGEPDPSIFSTPMNRAGIQVGTAIGMYLSTPQNASSSVLFRNLWGGRKREELIESLDAKGAEFDALYQSVNPEEQNQFSLSPMDLSENFMGWPALDSLCEFDSDGLMEKRGGALFDTDRTALKERMRDYFNFDITWDAYKAMGGGLAKNAARFDAEKTREKATAKGFEPGNIVPYTIHPFNNGHCYHSSIRPIWNENRPNLWRQYNPGNSFLVSRKAFSGRIEGAPMFFTACLGDNSAMQLARYIPLHLHKEDIKKRKHKIANLSDKARGYLRDLGFADPDKNSEAAEVIWLHALAVGYAPEYQTENDDDLRISWPRIPLPKNANALKQSAELGKKVRDLLDMETPLDWQTPLGRELSKLAMFAGDGGALEITKRKRAEGDNAKATMPELGVPKKVFINDKAWWENVPAKAWDFRIGGFQPPQKWLSHRARKARPLRPEEIRQFSDIIRRISALLLMEAELNDNYRAAKD